MTDHHANVARELDGICHDLLHIVAGMAKVLALYAPAEGHGLKADADSLFRKWVEVRAALSATIVIGIDVAAEGSDRTIETVFLRNATGETVAVHKDVTDQRDRLATNLPPSLAVKPNIPLEKQTLEQLRAERAYWNQQVINAAGFPSAKAAHEFRSGCERWIAIREAEEAKYHG